MSFFNLLTLAKNEYSAGHINKAFELTQTLVHSYIHGQDFSTKSKQLLFYYLDAITLHQSLLTLQNQPQAYLSYEIYIEDLIIRIYGTDRDFYYALHAFDICETMASHSFLIEAKHYKEIAISLLQKKYGNIPYLTFIEAVFDAKIAFFYEDYYDCIQYATHANNLWYSRENEQISLPYCPNPEAAFYATLRLGITNILLMCNAYGKINNPKGSIELLETLLPQQIFDYYQTMSAEITLTELYLIDGHTENARPLYEKYKNSNFSTYPGLAAALSSIAHILEKEKSDFSKTLSNISYCYSKNMFEISHYNYALGLTSKGNYEKALTEFQSAGKIGYSMQLFLLSQENRTSEIQALKSTVNDYFYRQIKQIISHYNEELAYNHLARLQYHLDLTLGAYCHKELSSLEAYEFLLNTKYIALETSFLIKEHKERPFYAATQVMELLNEHTLLLEYTRVRTLAGACYGVFLISKHTISYVFLGNTDTIDSLIENWLQNLQTSALATGKEATLLYSKFQDLNTKLRKLLFLPIKEFIPNDTDLLIAPAGAMVNFPFSQLPVSASLKLGDTHSICYLNTGKELLHKTDCLFHNTTIATPALVVGNPTVSSYVNLPLAEQEADMVSYFLQTNTYKNESATLSNILQALTTAPDILHIAAHGIYHTPKATNDEVNWDALYHAMTRSGIVLTDDALLSCAHISTFNLTNTRLTVLSCCHSGNAAYLGTEGAYGLRRAFFLAGCRALIVNLWQVDDTASFLWMKVFYEVLTITGASLSEAHKAAVSFVKNYETDGVHPYEHPFYWAGFVLISPHEI